MVLAQLLAGAQTDPKLAESTEAALRLWITPIEQALARLLTGSPSPAVRSGESSAGRPGPDSTLPGQNRNQVPARSSCATPGRS